MNLPPSFVQQADAQLLRIAALSLKEDERAELNRLTREKHSLLQEEAKYLSQLTAWADMVEADVTYRKALEESRAKTDRYYQTLDELRAIPAVTVTEYVAAEPLGPRGEEAA